MMILVHSDRILLKGGWKDSGLESKEVDMGAEMRGSGRMDMDLVKVGGR